MDFLTNWQLWAAIALVGVALEFVVGGVGILVVVSAAAALTSIFLVALDFLGLYLGWQAILLTYVAFVVVSILIFLAYRRYFAKQVSDIDINTY